MITIPFGKWLPDYEPKTNQLVEASGVLPYDGKYMPFPKPAKESAGAVAGTPRVVFNIETEGGNNKTFAGTSTKIYRLDGTAFTDITKTATTYATPAAWTWDWAVYGDNLIMTNGTDVIQKANPFTSAANFVDLGGTPPKAKACAMYGNHLFLLNTTDSGTNFPRRIWRSALGDIEDWNASGTTGAGNNDLASFGQHGTALKTLGNYLIAFMSDSVWAIQQMGAPIWFSYTKIHSGSGAVNPNAVARLDNNTLVYIGNDDIYMMSGTTIRSIGSGVRRRTIDQINPSNGFETITHLIDREKKTVIFAYPDTNSTDGVPNRSLIYNYEEGKFTEADIDVYCVGRTKSPGVVINSMTAANSYDTIDNTTNYAIDSSHYKGGTEQMGVVPSGGAQDKFLSVFSSTPYAATLKSGELDMDDIATITHVRPTIQSPSGTVTVKIDSRFDDIDAYTTASTTMDTTSGRADLLATGRYAEVQVDLAEDTTHQGIRGIKVEAVKAGKR